MKPPTMELMRPGQALQLGLPERAPDFARLLVAPPLDEVPLNDREWLHERYREIVPIVLLPALVAVEQGTPVPEPCLVARAPRQAHRSGRALPPASASIAPAGDSRAAVSRAVPDTSNDAEAP